MRRCFPALPIKPHWKGGANNSHRPNTKKKTKAFGGYLSLWSEVVKSNDIQVRLNGLMNLRL